MIGDPQRLQYLEAMGISTWGSRYRFVNARATEQSVWQPAAPAEKPAPNQRLHRLLETPATPVAREAAAATPETPRASSTRARALLENTVESPAAEGPGPESIGVPDAVSSTDTAQNGVADVSSDTVPEPLPAAAPLRFSLTLAKLSQRWWMILPGAPLTPAERKLLVQMLGAAGLPAEWATMATLTWPLMDMPTSDPEGEALDGLLGFCAGQATRNELAIEGLLAIGDDEVWSSLLASGAGSLAHPLYRWPHPGSLLAGAEPKRQAWPRLMAAGRAWASGRRDDIAS